jgi:parallel beta-helix repeat protein
VGIIIGANNITLNLRGFRVFGTASTGDGPGILLSNRSGVVVTNGTVTGFDAGVAIEGGAGNVLRGLTIRDNIGTGAGAYGDGIKLDGSSQNQIRANYILHNGPFGGITLTGATSTGNIIDTNQVLNNNVPRASGALNDDDGIRLEVGVSGNTVTNNRVENSGLDGIALFFMASDNVVRGNLVIGNGFHDKGHRKGDGIRVFNRGDRNRIVENRVRNNAANGIVLSGPTQTQPGAMNNSILRNDTGGNASLSPATTYDLHDGNALCDANVWRANTYDTAQPACTTTP